MQENSIRMNSLKTYFFDMGRKLVSGSVSLASVATLSSIAIFCFVLTLLRLDSLNILEERVGALSWTYAAEGASEDRLTIVAIDEKSISALGAWPWPREVMTNLSRAIDGAGAQLQIHDIIYPEGDSLGEELFAEELVQNGRSIIAQLPIIQTGVEPVFSGLLTHPVEGARCADEATTTGLQATSYLGASQSFERVPKGHIAPIIDSDGAVRKLPALVCFDGSAYPALSMAPLLLLSSGNDWSAEVILGRGLFSPSQSLQLGLYPGFQVPLDAQGNMRISFKKSPQAFNAISAVDILEGNYDDELLDNVLVLIGATAFGLDDIVPTPYSGSAPGVELQARALISILDNNVPYAPKGRFLIAGVISLLMAFILTALAVCRGRLALFGLPVAAFSMPFFSILVHGLLLTSTSLWVGWLSSAVFGFFGGLALLIVELARVRYERSRVMQNLTSYLPVATARKVAFELPSSSIQAERCNVTLLSADLRNFTALGESRPPEESASVLHYFFTRVNDIVERHGGKVHEYKGDNVLVIWDGDGIQPASKALAAAKDIEKDVNTSLLPQIGIDGLEPLAVGIGIEQGPALIGSIGPAHRRAHTLCGETVSVTLRIQEMTADLAYPILIGEVAARYMSDEELQSVGHFLLPGLTTTHVLFAPVSAEVQRPDKLKLLSGGLSQ